ncbi:hypothetical protein TRIUR3_18107 [Triticum urartu]|uniref:Uncharacterized protein n=1 Tax=Triticum urartu TaxID=4572 RepID=M7Y698_TRIUA|nr:hypothetical protein TRIUR3_18107 [Triticum urartu]
MVLRLGHKRQEKFNTQPHFASSGQNKSDIASGHSYTMKEQLKASKIKILAALLVFAMVTQGLAIRVKGTVRNDITDEAVSAKTTLGAGSSTTVDNHHAIPRDQYSSHGGEDGSGIGSGPAKGFEASEREEEEAKGMVAMGGGG